MISLAGLWFLVVGRWGRGGGRGRVDGRERVDRGRVTFARNVKRRITTYTKREGVSRGGNERRKRKKGRKRDRYLLVLL